LKERFSQDTWRVLQELDVTLSSTRPVHRERRMVAQMALMDRVIATLSAFAGLLMENSTRAPGWRFVQIGKRLERALQTTELLMATFSAAPEDQHDAMRTLLRIADSSITYRTRYFTTLHPEYVLALLMKDAGNPRSLIFQLEGLAKNLASLPNSKSADSNVALQLAQEAREMVRDVPLSRLCAGNMEELGELGRQLKGTLYDISDALNAAYFSHSVSACLVAPY
jgi:uncharacterized alpha-E superfamily protein